MPLMNYNFFARPKIKK